MKTDIDTFTASALLASISAVAPSISIEVFWSHDNGIHPDIRKNCGGMDEQDPDDWQAWQSEVRATAIAGGKKLTGCAYLGATWEKSCDHPAKSNPEISCYLPQMIEEALRELGQQTTDLTVCNQVIAALAII